MLKMLHPSARIPPSANMNACIASTQESAMNAPWLPSTAANSIPPPMWPLEPVPGIAKFIICAAKTNAPITPMSGTRAGSKFSFSLRALFQSSPALAAIMTPPTAGETSASAMCICFSFLWLIVLDWLSGRRPLWPATAREIPRRATSPRLPYRRARGRRRPPLCAFRPRRGRRAPSAR